MYLTRRITPFVVLSIALLTPIIGNAQQTDRSQLASQIEAMRTEMKQKEAQLLAVSDQDKVTYAEFLNQRDAGICRLMPREKYDGNLLIHGGGAYYSFTQSSSDFNSYPQIGLERGQLATGFIGADYGYIADLGEVPIDALNGEYSGVKDLTGFATPNAEQDARIEQRKSSQGLTIGNHVYKNRTGASVDHTYILRSVNYDRSDTLVAVRVIRQDDDGSIIILWRILNRFPTPQLIRADSR
jgi:hypothetical protein